MLQTYISTKVQHYKDHYKPDSPQSKTHSPLWEARVYAGQYPTKLHHCRSTSPQNHATTKLHYCKSPLPHQHTYKLLLVEEETGKTKQYHRPQTHRAIKPQTYIPTKLHLSSYQAMMLSGYRPTKPTNLQYYKVMRPRTNLQTYKAA